MPAGCARGAAPTNRSTATSGLAKVAQAATNIFLYQSTRTAEGRAYHPTAVLGLDSNALRVLQRLGYGREFPQWAKSYRSSQAAAERELPATTVARRAAALLLRRHGQTLCRRSSPRCSECPLQPDCPTGRARRS